MQDFSNALFDMIGKIVGAATKSDDGYPARLIGLLKVRFSKIFGFAESLLGSASAEK